MATGFDGFASPSGAHRARGLPRAASRTSQSNFLTSINEGTETNGNAGDDVQEDCFRYRRNEEQRSISDTWGSMKHENLRRSFDESGRSDRMTNTPRRRNRLKKGPNSQSFTIAAINSAFQCLPYVVALVWAAATFYSMATIAH